MNKLGCHVQQLTPQVLDWISLARPLVIVWVDPHSDGVNEIRKRSPGTFIVGRKYERGQSWLASWLRRTSRRILYDAIKKGTFALGRRVDKIAVHRFNLKALIEINRRGWDLWAAAVSPESRADQCAALAHCDAWICWNEPFGHDDAHLFAQFDEWQVRFLARIRELGSEGVAFNFGTGNFTKAGPDIRASFPLSCDAFRYFGVHEYYWPSLFNPAAIGWHTMRFPYWYESIGRDDVEIIMTECGLTQAVHEGRPDRGWRDDVPDRPSIQDYLRDWEIYNKRLCDYPYVKGAAIFNWGGYGWETFEHADHDIRFQIAAIDAPEPSPPPNGGDSMVKIYDFEHGPPDGQTRDWAWLHGVFGEKLKIHPVTEQYPQIALGEPYYAVNYLDARTGESSCIINTRGEDGQPREWEMVIFSWDSAELLKEQGLAPRDWAWTDRGAVGETNESGDVGPGMGKGAYYDPATEEGPHQVWVYDIPSELVSGIGMLATGEPEPGTLGPHAHVNIGFVRKQWQGDSPTPPPDDDHAVRLHTLADEIHTIANAWPVEGTALSRVTLTFQDGTVKEITL